VIVSDPAVGHTASRLGETLATLTGPGVANAIAVLAHGADLTQRYEAPLVRAVPTRRREFAVGRQCARIALRSVGCRAGAIGRGRFGEPLWPPGFGGSITHGRVFAAAIAFRVIGDLVWGLDLVDEPDRSVFESIRHSVLSDAEAYRLGRVDAETIATVFSAKEATIKILSPRLRRYVDFLELEVAQRAGGLAVAGRGGESVMSRSAWVDDVLITVAAQRHRGT
jgi:4'-phosphopantetheinyl transferase EntD